MQKFHTVLYNYLCKDKDQEDKDTVFEMLSEEHGRVSRHDIAIALGDFNATMSTVLSIVANPN